VEIKLICYAVLQEIISDEPISLKIPEECTAMMVIELLSQNYPQAEPILKSTRLAHRDRYIEKSSLVIDGEEYCLIPPVSGG
tara:strand:+ start:583 stop:828 length:246 start_codon:yes stop_codon:yes gene_type:complete